MNKLLSGIALTAMLGAGFASCTTDVDGLGRLDKNHLVVNKAPKIVAYSGNHTWGNDLQDPFKLSTRASDFTELSVRDIVTTYHNKDDEKAYLDDYLPEGADNSAKVDFDFLFYTKGETKVELYPVYAQTGQTHSLGIFFYDQDGDMHEQVVWEDVDVYNNYNWEGKLTGKEVTIPAGVFFGFFLEKGNNLFLTKDKPWETTPINRLYSTASMNPPAYPINEQNQADTEAEMVQTHAVTWVRTFPDGQTKNYLGFEDWCDFDYQDLVFAITPEVKTVDASDFVPGVTEIPGDEPKEEPKEECDQCHHDSHEPGNCPTCGENEGCNKTEEPKDKCDKCDHDSHDPGNCPTCGENEGCNKKDDSNNNPNVDPDPVVPPVVAGDDHTNEVEVNLAVDTKGETSGGKYNESHLSIHVRSAVDIDMFIPMPLEYICPADDMEIVKQHLQGDMQHGGEFQNATTDADGKVVMEGGLLSKMTYMVEGHPVTLYVEYVAAGTETAHGKCNREFTADGIHIWSEGLEGNTALFETLQQKYGDGITFEIWNYFDPKKTLEELKEQLDQATIDFIGDKLPDYFINAFGSANYEEGKDCTVGLVEDQADNFEFKGEGGHLNGSDHNRIYENKNHKSPTEPAPAQ